MISGAIPFSVIANPHSEFLGVIANLCFDTCRSRVEKGVAHRLEGDTPERAVGLGQELKNQ